ncbi:MAG: peptidoglycan DD-metalloendopeptidase family protein [Halothiobacillaceae bacterium]|jgi:lipoprotein NlpD|nr:peptidoglycan DD-metalloendopeptidase family protein [Halothiobacillaceae bacterium]
MKTLTRIVLVSMLLFLAGCASSSRFPAAGSGGAAPSPAGPGEHVVRPGDTLYSIAVANDMDFRQLAALNGIRPPYTIQVGQRLRVVDRSSSRPKPDPEPKVVKKPEPPKTGAPVKTTPPLPTRLPITWRWPTVGKVVGRFVAGDATRKGVDIAGRLGQPVLAAADGEVVYSGSGLPGYGKLVILKHSHNYLSAYGYNQALLVDEGQQVKAGQTIARMGQAEVGKSRLHFEIRYDGKPVDPLRYLPKR